MVITPLELGRVKKLFEILEIRKRLMDTLVLSNRQTFRFDLKEFDSEPLLEDRNTLKDTLELIHGSSGGRITWEIVTFPTKIPHSEKAEGHTFELFKKEVQLVIHVPDPSQLNSYLDDVMANLAEKEDPRKKLVYRDTHGNFYYNEEKMEIDRTKLYFDVFDVLFTYYDRATGFMPYEEIEKQLIKRGYPPKKSTVALRKRVNNAIRHESQGFFRNVNVLNLRTFFRQTFHNVLRREAAAS